MPNLTTSKKAWYWKICVAVVFLLVIICFSPLVLLPKELEPFAGYLPRTLWASLLIYIVLFLCTIIGAIVYPYNQNPDKKQK